MSRGFACICARPSFLRIFICERSEQAAAKKRPGSGLGGPELGVAGARFFSFVVWLFFARGGAQACNVGPETTKTCRRPSGGGFQDERLLDNIEFFGEGPPPGRVNFPRRASFAESDFSRRTTFGEERLPEDAGFSRNATLPRATFRSGGAP